MRPDGPVGGVALADAALIAEPDGHHTKGFRHGTRQSGGHVV